MTYYPLPPITRHSIFPYRISFFKNRFSFLPAFRISFIIIFIIREIADIFFFAHYKLVGSFPITIHGSTVFLLSVL